MAAKGTIELQDLNGNPITPEEIQGGQSVIAIVTPPDGYEYNRWVDNGGNTIIDGIQELDDNTFLITVECGILYKVIFKKVGDGTCSIDTFIYFNNGINETLCTDCGTVDVSEYYCNGQAVIEALPNCCYEFMRWDDGNTSNPRTVGVTIGSHLEYRAIVQKKINSINAASSDSNMGTLYIGTEDGSYLQTEPYAVRCGEKFMLKAVTTDTKNNRYEFDGWSDLSESDINYKTNPRVVEFDCTMAYGAFDKSPLTEYTANFKEVEKYRICYHSGTSADTKSYDPKYYSVGDEYITKPSNTFSYANHTFTGWAFNNTMVSYAGDTAITLTSFIASLADANSVIHMYATWSEARQGTVTYNLNGGTGTVPASQTDYFGNTIVLNDGNGISMTGQKLVGWCTTNDGTGAVYALSGNYIIEDTTVTLYACWTQLYTVEYNPNGGIGNTIIDNNSGNYYDINDTVTVYSNAETNYTLANHMFLGWNTESDGSGTPYIAGSTFSIQENMVLYAIWKENETSTLTLYNANGSSAYSQYTGYIGNQVLLDYIPTLEHYIFRGWATQVGGSVVYHVNDNYTLISGGSALYAVWTEEPKYRVYYSGNGSTSGSVADFTEYYAGQTATVKGQGTLVKSGSPYNCTFNGWYTNSQGTGGTAYSAGSSLTVTGNITLYAQWSCCPITIVVNTSVGGSLNVNGTTVTTQGTFNFNNESQISITAYPAENYALLGWLDNATGYYITPTSDGSCAKTLPDSTRYAYVVITPMSTPSSYTTNTTLSGAAVWATASDYANYKIAYNPNIDQYYQCIDLSLMDCPVEMVCGGTYTAVFVECPYGRLTTLCDTCPNGYRYVESDPIYVYESLGGALDPTMTPTLWRDEVSALPSTVSDSSPMYLEVSDSSSYPIVYEYYKKVYSNGAYSYEQLTGTDAQNIYLAAPKGEEYSPDYVEDSLSGEYYYKIGYDGTNVTNVTKAYFALPTEYLGDVISWYDYQTNHLDEDGYYNTTNYKSSRNKYYEWRVGGNGYTLIPQTQSYAYDNADMTTNTIFFQTQYLNYTYIRIHDGDRTSGVYTTYKWNSTLHIYEVTSDTPSLFNGFYSVEEFMKAYLRDDGNGNPITAYFAEDSSTGYIDILRWDGSAYVSAFITPIFNDVDGISTSYYTDQLNSLFPINGRGIHCVADGGATIKFHFGDTLNFNNNVYQWDTTTEAYVGTSGTTAIEDAHAHVYSKTPSISAGVPSDYIGTYIMYDGNLMKLRYCFTSSCQTNLYYEQTGYTVSRNNVIGTTSAASDGLYVTQRTSDSYQKPTAMSVSAANYISNTYGTPSQSDPNNIMVVSAYYLGDKGTLDDLEYPCWGMSGSYSAYNDIPAWRARTGLTDGNPTENMYVFPGRVVSEPFHKYVEYKVFTKECQPT